MSAAVAAVAEPVAKKQKTEMEAKEQKTEIETKKVYGPHGGECSGIYCDRCYEFGCPRCLKRTNRRKRSCWACGWMKE